MEKKCDYGQANDYFCLVHLFVRLCDKHSFPDCIHSIMGVGGREEEIFHYNPDIECWYQNWHFQNSPIILSVPLAGGVQEEVL